MSYLCCGIFIKPLSFPPCASYISLNVSILYLLVSISIKLKLNNPTSFMQIRPATCSLNRLGSNTTAAFAASPVQLIAVLVPNNEMRSHRWTDIHCQINTLQLR